jgi:cytochrome P450
LLDGLRTHEPVTWIPELGGWFVTSYELARSLLLPRDDVTVQSEQSMVRASLGRMMLTVDRDEHARQRKPFEPPFRPREIENRFQEFLSEQARQLVNDMLSNSEIDIVEHFATPFAIETAGYIVGFDLGDVSRISDFYADFAGAMIYDGDPEPLIRANRARDELNELLRASLASDRARNSLAASVTYRDTDELSEDELLAQLRVIMFGAIETIQASVSNTLMLLLQKEPLWKRVTDSPELVNGAVVESLRIIPPVTFAERWAKDDLSLGDVTVARGEFIGISILGANHDQSVFTDPHSFDLDRSNAHRALSFSFGEHHCLGYHLARLETVTAVSEVVRRMPRLRLVDAAMPEGFAFRRPSYLRVALAE